MKISQIIEQNKKPIILVALYIPGEKNQGKVSIRGTGFIVSHDGKFLTCWHVYKNIPENELRYLEVSVPGKTDEKGITHYDRYKVKLLDKDEENDLALMQIISDKNNFETIEGFGDSESVKEGDEVVFIGYPLATVLLGMKFGITMNTNHCIISSVKRRGKDGSLHFFMIDTHINKGSSGSPVFSLDSGKVIGVTSGRISQRASLPSGKKFDIPANMGICRPTNYAVDLINK
ncbi:trypsin-like peptidase domain-containing protein [Patescibacteria group bacterium]|nr:trypsin-like peptidase domain-containing protein [Patescibacteria group bacterium]